MKIIHWHLENSKQGCDLTGQVEVEDGADDETIEEAVREDLWNFLSLTWRLAE